jgi:carbamoyltransferase
MKICGLKLTHDGAVALIDGDQLIFSVELEKLNNNPRYSMIEDAFVIEDILNSHGYSLSDVDHFAIDGWGGYNAEELAIQPRLRIGEQWNYLSIENNGYQFELNIAQYHEDNLSKELAKGLLFEGLHISSSSFAYSSYLHVTGHILSAYCTSPFAQRGKDACVLVWDGGMFPRLYGVRYKEKQIVPFGPLFLLIGNIYTIFSQHFGPFKVSGKFAKDSLSVAGKVMAYIAKGVCHRELFPVFRSLIDEGFDNSMGYANQFAEKFKKRIVEEGMQVSDEDVLRSFHEYLGELLIEKLAKKMKRIGEFNDNLCIAGGCALNIKWNSAIRNAGIFKEVYVPPFPNDSGSAIGVACAKRFELTGNLKLGWNVYCGPLIKKNSPSAGWSSTACDVKKLAKILHHIQQPVVMLNGRAELGPRALGNRSILAPACSKDIKNVLNIMKDREDYRPVSPICLEAHAAELFLPGTNDPFMLFDHTVKNEWIDRIPGIVHLDNTARLQTVNRDQNIILADLLEEYRLLSGIPLLCNTSANYNGKGFFPDVFSATAWDKAEFVWCEDTLYFKEALSEEVSEILNS